MSHLAVLEKNDYDCPDCYWYRMVSINSMTCTLKYTRCAFLDKKEKVEELRIENKSW